MGDLDQVSAAIGELKGLMVAHNAKLDAVDLKVVATQSEVGQIKTQYISMSADGCARGKSNGHRLTSAESEIKILRASKMTGKDFAKVFGGATGITAVITAIVEIFRQGGAQ